MRLKKIDWFALLFILAFLIIGIVTLPNYGISWDEGLGNMFFGERYFLYLTSFQDKYLDFKTDLIFHNQTPLNLALSPFRNHPNEFPALADTLSAATMYLFSYRLNWLDPVDGFHFFTILLSSIFLWFLYRFSSRHLGPPAGLISIALLAIYPRFWADMHFNPKDVPSTIFFSFSIMAYLSWYEKPSLSKAAIAGLVTGCALGIKANSLFIPVILILGVWYWGTKPRQWINNFSLIRKYWPHYCVMIISAVLIYWLSWPYLYSDPTRFREYYRYIFSQGDRQGGSGWNLDPFLQVMAVSPEYFIILLSLGFIFIVKKSFQDSEPIWKLLPVWLIIPIVRSSFPGMVNFNGIRHFLEFVPAACMIAAYGMVRIINAFNNRKPLLRGIIISIISLLIFTNLAIITTSFSPFQHLFYNRFIGGLAGAAQKFGPDEATDYWATSYRKGISWLNQNAEPDAILYVPIADWLVKIPAKIWIRPDIIITNRDFVDSFTTSDKPIYIMLLVRPGFFDDFSRELIANHTPIYQLRVDDMPILYIYKYNLNL